ncbi:MAG: SEC59/DGK1/VTE5 family protein [Melioribacteraceae bacterium]|nr:MAG: SEC59/DGK1/VTE5 family protein [Melioribacteraceae bacterium]
MKQKMTALDKGSIDYKYEILRKGIHLVSLSIPVIYYFITRELALTILVPLVIFSIALDLLRYQNPSIGKVFYKLFGFLLREHEKDHEKRNLSGATYVLIAAVLTVLIFPKVITVSAFTILIISDISAALIGRRFGRIKFLSKSLEGTAAFFISACIVIILAPKVDGLQLEYIIGFIAAFVGAIAENISYGYADDNLTIPLSIGFTMWALYALFLPNMNLVLSGVPN